MSQPGPLSARVSAPAILPIPESDSELTWRSVRLEDVKGIMDCQWESDRVEHPEYLLPEEDMEDELKHSYFNLESDSLIALDSNGSVVGYGLAIQDPGQQTLVRVILEGTVRPSQRGRGIGRQILAWQEARALQMFAASSKELPGWMVIFAEDRAPETQRLALHSGFELSRHFLSMNRDLSRPIPQLASDWFEVVPFDESLSQRVFDARNDAFQDHWGSQPLTLERWNEVVVRSTFRGDLSRIALTPEGEIAGFVLSEVNPDDFVTQGFSSAYILLVGVPRAFRRRGVARVLLASALQAYSEAGLEKAVLDVDSASPTGADGLYGALGFETVNSSVALVKEY